MNLFLTFSAALGNMSKLYCTRLHENWRRLGIIQVNLASALALHKRSYICRTLKLIRYGSPFNSFGIMPNRAPDFKNRCWGRPYAKAKEKQE